MCFIAKQETRLIHQDEKLAIVLMVFNSCALMNYDESHDIVLVIYQLTF